MTSIFSKALVLASVLIFVSGAAEAKNFFKQAVTDVGNGLKAVGGAIAPRRPSPTEPSRSPMNPCTPAPGACQTAPKA